MQPDCLGPYRIERKLGRGGMGTVYAGVDGEGRRVAVKVLSPALAAEPGFRQRFDAEIESLKKLMHPGIVRLFGFGEQDDYVFYAMEFVDGPSVEDELRAGRRFSWRETAELAAQIGRALRHAHDHGVIHRDLKPANLLMADEDQIKLSDFGIARLFGQRLTGSGGVLGTAEYMAPEQAAGQPVTPRCDLYSLGCVMYAMLTGQPPFRAESLPAMIDKHRRESPRSLSELSADVPADMERIVGRLLAKSPDERIATAQALVRELEMMIDRLDLGSSRAQPATPPATGVREAAESRGASGGDSGGESGVAVLADTDFELPQMPPLSAVGSTPRHAAGERGAVADPSTSPARPRFESVESAATDRPGRPWWQFALAALPTAVALAALVALIVYLVRGPSIDERFAAIEQAAAEDNPALLADQEREIERLVDDMDPSDLRLDRLREYQSRIDLWRIERRLVRGLPTAMRSAGRTPLERMLADALWTAESDPAKAMQMLETIIALYGEPGADRGPTAAHRREIVAIARRNLTRLAPVVERQRADQKAVIDEAMARAEALDESDPEAARRIREALLRQFGDERWTEQILQRARDKLEAEAEEGDSQ